MPDLLFCELDYNLVDGVCVFDLRYKGVTQIEQALNYKVALGVGECAGMEPTV